MRYMIGNERMGCISFTKKFMMQSSCDVNFH